MKNTKRLLLLLTVLLALLLVGCSNGDKGNVSTDGVVQGAQSVVPAKADLIKSLKAEGYKVKTEKKVYDLDVDGERVYAEKDGAYIDICYGLSAEDAVTAFELFEEKYWATDYYILARNETFVYCISNKTVFSDSGFKSTDNVGIQYIHE